MREGWTYKKLGEVCRITSGFTPKADDLYSFGSYPYFKVADMNTPGNEIFMSVTSSYLKDSKKYFTAQSIVFPKNGATIATNKKRILAQDSIVDLNTAIAEFSEEVISKYSYYWFVNVDFKDYMRGGALPTLDLKSLKETLIPLPPKSQQEAIVSELDEINSLLALKREQLQKYDKLAQSLFYEMFGDPVENEKGWEVKKFGEVGTFTRCNGIVKNDFVEQGKPCIHYGQIHTKFGPSIYSHLTEISEKLFDKSKKASTGDIIIAITSEDIEGSCKCTAWLGNYDIAVGAHAAIFKHNQNPLFVSYYFKSNAFFAEKSKYARGFKVMEIKPSDIEKIPIYLPPLTLQQQFASRIEQIELQKQQVQAAIEKLETLLASRMQYWFE